MLGAMVLIFFAYGKYNHGLEFFPAVEPESAQVWVRARGDMSIYEKDALLQKVEQRLLGLSEVKALYARSMASAGGELALYDEHDQLIDKFLPTAGSLVLFESERFPHQVLPAIDTRYSIAGWFRKNASINGVLDPAS